MSETPADPPAAEPPARAERIPLDLTESTGSGRRGCAAVLVALILGGAIGGLVGLLADQTAALVTAGVIIALLLLLSWASGRRRLWLEGGVLVAKTIGYKRVDLRTAERIELLVTDVRGTRRISMLVGEKGRSINLGLAIYAGTGGRELGILVLRRLADVLASSEHSGSLVFSQLLVAQLRAEAKGDAAADRPLYRLAALAPTGRMNQRLRPEAVTRFVASLD